MITVKNLLIKFQEYTLEKGILNANFAHNGVANNFMKHIGIEDCIIGKVDTEKVKTKNIFEKGNRITTNRRNVFEIIDVNESQIVCRDLLNDDFSVFDKTEHDFEIADVKIILELSLKEIVDETEISDKDKKHILFQMGCRFSNWLKVK